MLLPKRLPTGILVPLLLFVSLPHWECACPKLAGHASERCQQDAPERQIAAPCCLLSAAREAAPSESSCHGGTCQQAIRPLGLMQEQDPLSPLVSADLESGLFWTPPPPTAQQAMSLAKVDRVADLVIELRRLLI